MLLKINLHLPRTSKHDVAYSNQHERCARHAATNRRPFPVGAAVAALGPGLENAFDHFDSWFRVRVGFRLCFPTGCSQANYPSFQPRVSSQVYERVFFTDLRYDCYSIKIIIKLFILFH